MEDSSAPVELTLTESDLTPTPFELFQTWFTLAVTRSGLSDPNAFCLSTVDEAGYPDARLVLLKEFDQRGFVFYTNSLSIKGRSLAKTPRASLTVYWDSLRRQVRIKGDVEKVDDAQSDLYFASRPRLSQLGAWASLQSEHLADRETFEERLRAFDEKFPDSVPRPPHWFGYRVRPFRMEFWQDRRNRLHDRFVYDLRGETWNVSRLYP